MTALAQIQETMISGKWLLDVIPVLAGAAAVILGRNHWKSQGAKEAQTDVTLKKPIPTIETREKPVPATKCDLDAHISKTSQDIGRVHNRLDDQVKALARMEGSLASVEATVGKLLDIALGKKPNPRA